MPRPDPSRSGDPARRASRGSSPGRDTAHGTVPERSRGVLVALSQLPALVLPGIVLALMLVGLAAPPVIAVPALAVIGLFVGWLAWLSWPILTTRERMLRALMGALVVAAAAGRIGGWL